MLKGQKTAMLRTICEYFFWFQLYSIVGWIMETLLYIIRDKKFVKRGFLFGPLCPIYGTGAIICSAVFYGKTSNIFILFFGGLLLCGTIEYLTHFFMEKFFNAMWWDYSSRRFNIKGRVYLNGLLTFGLGVVLIIRVTQPIVVKLTDKIPNPVLYIMCFVLYTIFIVDLTTTIADLKGIVNALKNIQSTLLLGVQKGIDITDEKITELANGAKENNRLSEFTNWITSDNALIRRIKGRYPDFTLKKYKAILDVIMDKPQEEKARKDIKLYGTADSLPTPEEEKEEIKTH